MAGSLPRAIRETGVADRYDVSLDPFPRQAATDTRWLASVASGLGEAAA